MTQFYEVEDVDDTKDGKESQMFLKITIDVRQITRSFQEGIAYAHDFW